MSTVAHGVSSVSRDDGAMMEVKKGEGKRGREPLALVRSFAHVLRF